jgi:serine/threonine-protein kinase RsbW
MKDKAVFNTCPEAEFFGRAGLVSGLSERASGDDGAPQGTFIVGRRWSGKTEVLRRVYNDLFWNQARVQPVYLQLGYYPSVEEFSEGFLKETLKQTLAFKVRAPRLSSIDMTLDRLEDELLRSGLDDLIYAVRGHSHAKAVGDVQAMLKNSIGLPLRASAEGTMPVFLVLDDIDALERIGAGGNAIVRAIMDSLGRGRTGFLASMRLKKTVPAGLPAGAIEVKDLKGLDNEAGVLMLTELCRMRGVGFDTEILKLAAARLEGNPMYIKNIVSACRTRGAGLDGLKDFIDAYVSEITEGSISFALNSAVSIKGINELKALFMCALSSTGCPVESMAERLRLNVPEAQEMIERLCVTGMIEMSLGVAKWTGDTVERDFIGYAYETRVKGRAPNEARTGLVKELLKSGYNQRSIVWQGRLKSDCEEMLNNFNGQRIAKILLNNRVFSMKYRNNPGLTNDKRGEVFADEEPFVLPQIVGCFDADGSERQEMPPMLVAHGFQNNRYDANNEVVWIVAVKEALSPVNIGDVESFIRRSAILRDGFRTTRVVKWIVGREGFTGEAIKRIEADGIFSSDIVQTGMIRSRIEEGLSGEAQPKARAVPAKEFEVILPATSKSELVAVRAVEEIGTEMGFDEHSIGQIKSAVVEACINAFEHSRISSARVFLRFVSSPDRLTIHVQNKGEHLDGLSRDASKAHQGAKGATLPHKRGWGIELMKGLMDEVRVEKIRDGAKIVLVKYLMQKGEGRDEKPR